MRMSLRIDDRIMKELLALTSAKTKTEAVCIAITDFLRRKGKEQLLSLRGKLNLAEDWSELREAELNEK